jgi:preprotein translocase subunit YajC
MTYLPAVLHLLAATSTKKSSSELPLLLLLVVAVAGYFFFLRPQQRKAAAARANVGSGYEVGDEVQTIGGVIGTILEIHGDRYTLLTGHVGTDGNLEGAQPTRIVFVRQAIARKVEPVADVAVADDDMDMHGDHSTVEDDDGLEDGDGHGHATGSGGTGSAQGSGGNSSGGHGSGDVDDTHEETEEA